MTVIHFYMCSKCCILVCLLFTYWEIYGIQYLDYLSVWRYKLVNSFSTAYPVVFQMPLFMPHGMCQVYAAVLLCSHCACLVFLSSLGVDAMKVLNYAEGCVCQMQVPAVWSRSRYIPHPLLSAVALIRCTVCL